MSKPRFNYVVQDFNGTHHQMVGTKHSTKNGVLSIYDKNDVLGSFINHKGMTATPTIKKKGRAMKDDGNVAD